jgi:hypothetical protein
MISDSGIGGGPGCGCAGIRFTSNFGGAAIGPGSCARTQGAAQDKSAAIAAIKPKRFIDPSMLP